MTFHVWLHVVKNTEAFQATTKCMKLNLDLKPLVKVERDLPYI